MNEFKLFPRYERCISCCDYKTLYPYCDTCVDGNRFRPSLNEWKDALDEFKEYTKTKVKEFDEMIFNELKKHGIEDRKDFSRVQAIPQMTYDEGIEVESKWYVDGEHVFDLCKRTSRMYKSGMIYKFQVEYFIRKDAI